MLREVEATGKYETTRRLRSMTGSVFRYAIVTGRASVDPTYALQGALIQPQVAPRAALKERRKLGRLLCAIDDSTGHPGTRIALQLLALLAPRPGELRQARWEEFDLEERVWRIPAERMKMRRPIVFPYQRKLPLC
ncbi:MAG: hypothetical protein AAF577_07935 [Pseudomonadota bacterium]